MFRRYAVSLLAVTLMSAAVFSPRWASAQTQTVPTIAAASDLKFALEEVVARFERDTGHKLRLVFGSSGNFYSQILQGAPFQMFMSADEEDRKSVV